MTQLLMNDEGHRVFRMLSVLTGTPKVVQFLDESEEGKALLESLYELRDSTELRDRFCWDPRC